MSDPIPVWVKLPEKSNEVEVYVHLVPMVGEEIDLGTQGHWRVARVIHRSAGFARVSIEVEALPQSRP